MAEARVSINFTREESGSYINNEVSSNNPLLYRRADNELYIEERTIYIISLT
jgi:hypothetical protein